MTTSRSLKSTGVALAGAAAIAVAAPAVVPGQIAGLPSALSVSKAEYQLTALSDINFQQLGVAAASGFGGLLGPTDAFFPGQFNNDVLVKGLAGAAYYLVDTAGFVPLNLDRYFFEVGANNPVAGLAAAAYVGAGSVFGLDSPITQVIQAVSGGGSAPDLGSAIVALTAGIPVVGDLASVYFTGAIPGDTTAYGTGLKGLLTYATNKLLPAGLGSLFQNLNLNGLITTITGLISSVTGGNGIRPWHSEGDGSDSEGSDDNESESEDGHSAQRRSAAAVAAKVRTKSSAKAKVALAAPAASHAVAGAEGTGANEAVEVSAAPECDTTPATDTAPAAGDSSSTEAAQPSSPAVGATSAGPARRIAAAVRGLSPKAAKAPRSLKRGKVSRVG